VLIRQLELAGYHFPSINSKFSFKNGLNIVNGRNCSGKTILLSSISAAFLGTNYHDQWIQGDSAPRNSPEQFFPNQEPNIRVKFDWEGNSYELRKEFTRSQGVKCELFAISDDGTKTLQCEGHLAIEQCMKISEIRFVNPEYFAKISRDFYSWWISEESVEERKQVQGLIAKFRPNFLKKHSHLYGSEKPQYAMAAGDLNFLIWMSILASSRENGDRELLLVDDFGTGMDHSLIEDILRVITEEELCNQIILTSHNSIFPDGVGDNSIANHIITLPNPTNHQ